MLNALNTPVSITCPDCGEVHNYIDGAPLERVDGEYVGYMQDIPEDTMVRMATKITCQRRGEWDSETCSRIRCGYDFTDLIKDALGTDGTASMTYADYKASFDFDSHPKRLENYIGMKFADIVNDPDFKNKSGRDFDWEYVGDAVVTDVQGDTDFGAVYDYDGNFLCFVDAEVSDYITLGEHHGCFVYPDVRMMQFLGHDELITLLPDVKALKYVSIR
ncbi:MAG: hypothetical protein GY841_22130 [FCB group bacterium]|nr:hypothetical protein [FCB group bacterium]